MAKIAPGDREVGRSGFLNGRVRQSLDASLSDRRNNLNLVRMLAASAVLFSHAFPISLGIGATEPLEQPTGMSLGWYAVAIFFGLSGLLIASSFERRRAWHQFWTARVLRLFPALFVILVLTLFAGFFLTSLSPAAYLSSVEVWTYAPRNLSLAFLQYPLPGVFEANPYPRAINGSLWTLFYEVACYTLLFCGGALGLLGRRWAITIGVIGLGMAFVLLSNQPVPQGPIAVRIYHLVMLGFPFALGILTFVWREHFNFDWRLALVLWLGYWLASDTALGVLALVIALLYSAGWFGFVPKGKLLLYNRLGDYSYGMYIYAFPMQQAIAMFFSPLEPWMNMAVAFPASLLAAILSWHLVERRSLAHIKTVAARVHAAALFVSSGIRGLAHR